jgi:pimeloyl-ACP methyl ester carboxylesterase
MAKLFVHGNPETADIWTSLIEGLRDLGVSDAKAISPPGFGSPLPETFEPTQLGYRQWLIDQLEAAGGDVDLVGHDWGAGHVYGVLAARPDLVRSWAADCAGLLHPDYTWHDAARAWQTPEVGEQVISAMVGSPAADRKSGLCALGIPEPVAELMAQAQDESMGRCILELYRSAPESKMTELGQRLSDSGLPPGLVLIATEDHYAGSRTMHEFVAERLGAKTMVMEGLGHWWMFEGSEKAAEALVQHWADL